VITLLRKTNCCRLYHSQADRFLPQWLWVDFVYTASRIYGMQHNFTRWLVLISTPIDLAAECSDGVVKIARAKLARL